MPPAFFFFLSRLHIPDTDQETQIKSWTLKQRNNPGAQPPDFSLQINKCFTLTQRGLTGAMEDYEAFFQSGACPSTQDVASLAKPLSSALS